MTRLDLHPAGMPWYLGPTDACDGDVWLRRARRLLRKRLTSPLSYPRPGDVEPLLVGVLQRVQEVRDGDLPYRLLRWTDVREDPVILEGGPVPRRPDDHLGHELTRLEPGQTLRSDDLLPGTTTVRRVVVDLGTSVETADAVEVRHLVDTGDPYAVGLLRTQLTGDRLEDLLPELDAIARATRVTDTAPARRPRRIEGIGPGVAVALLAGLAALVAYYGLALTDRPETADTVRTWARWIFGVLSLTAFVDLARDRQLIRTSVGDRDVGSYIAIGLFLVLLGGWTGAVIAIGAGLALAWTAGLWWIGRHPSGVGAQTRMNLALLGAFSGVVLLFVARDADLGDVRAATIATAMVLAWVLALLPLAALWRDRLAFPFEYPYAVIAVGSLAIGVANGVWISGAVAIVLAVAFVQRLRGERMQPLDR